MALTLTAPACGQNVEAIEESYTAPVTVEAVVPKSIPMTLEEIRAEQEKLEAQIAEIRAKGELERADKIALLKMKRRYNALLDAELEIQDSMILEQKKLMAKEFAEIRSQISK